VADDDLSEPLELSATGKTNLMLGEDKLELEVEGTIMPPLRIPRRAASRQPVKITEADAEGPGQELRGDGSSIKEPKIIINMTLEEE